MINHRLRVLGYNSQRAPFFLVLYKTSEMDDAILDKDVLQAQIRPSVRIELGKKSLSNRAIIEAGRLGNITRCESLQQIAARD